MSAKHFFAILGLAILPLAGCLSPVRQETDALLCHRAGLTADLMPPGTAALLREEQPPVKPRPAKPNLEERLELPAPAPGWDAPRLAMPNGWRKFDEKKQDALLAKYFPPQLSMGADPKPVPGPNGRPLTLADLQRLAREHSPLVRQAATDIKAMEGAALQAGLYPNPTLGVMSNSIGPNGGPIFGPTISQTIKTMGKLKLSQAAATMDLANAQLAYRRAETDLMAQVRQHYFAVLVAETSIRANRALAELTDEVYKVMLQQHKGGIVATYEPAQVGVFAAQARMAVITAHNSYLLAWKQLAAALGRPEMPATEVAGGVAHSLPRFDFDKALAHVLVNHTDALTAQYTIEKSRYNLRLAQVNAVPDVTLNATVAYDATSPGPPRWITFFGASVPVPLFDRNQGGIKQAQAQLMRANEEPHRVQSALTAAVADAYNRVELNRKFLETYRKQMLPQQAQAFRAVVQRHYGAGLADDKNPAFNDLIAAEQSVVNVITAYLTTLQAYWQAISDLASLLQTDDVYQMAVEIQNVPTPNLAELLKLPCCHPCAQQPQPAANATLSFDLTPGQPAAPAGAVSSPQTSAPATGGSLQAPGDIRPGSLGVPMTATPGIAGRKL
jgi:outer membrane protein, heavy metal efflux system